MNESIGLAMGSGSARGLAHIGVLKVLEQNNIPISYIAGSSIGALIGAHYCCFQSAEKLEQLVIDITEKKLIHFIDLSVKGGFLKGDKLESFIEEVFKDKSFSHMRIPFAAVATDMNSGSKIVFKSGNLIKALRASISIPALLRPVHYNSMLLADGGLSDPIPVDVVKKMGATKVIAVNLDSYVVRKSEKKHIPISNISLNSINILRHNLAQGSLAATPYVITPLVNSEFFAWNDFFNKEKVKEFIAEGERATREVLPALLAPAANTTVKRQPLLRRLLDVLK